MGFSASRRNSSRVNGQSLRETFEQRSLNEMVTLETLYEGGGCGEHSPIEISSNTSIIDRPVPHGLHPDSISQSIDPMVE